MSLLLSLRLIASPAAAEDLHVVHAGETLESIAAGAGVAPADVRAANPGDAGRALKPGDLVRLPGGAPSAQSMVLTRSGSGRVTLPGGVQAPLTPGMSLPIGCTVCTDPESYTTLRLAAVDETHAHDEVTLLAGTCLTLDGSSVRSGRRSSVVSVQQGSVAVRDSGAAPGTVSVRAGQAVTAGEAGGFRLTVEEGGAARTEAITHPVAVFGAQTQVELAAGYGSRVEEGKIPSAPVPLLLGGALLSPGPGEPLRTADFSWEGVPYALSFRVEIATDPEFSDLLRVAEVSRLRWDPERLMLPYRGIETWWWRVTPVDRLGFVGVPSSPSRLAVPPGVGR